MTADRLLMSTATAWRTVMAIRTGRTRTITGYISDLLEYPRWIIERDVDFTNCRYEAHFNTFIEECMHCRFGPACRWLDRHKAASLEHASVEDLVAALEGAVAYLRKAFPHDHDCVCETCMWLREARHFRRSHLKST